MRNLKAILVLSVASLVAISCSNNVEQKNEQTPTIDKVNVSINGSMPDANTKTTIDYGNTEWTSGERTKWLNDDKISLFISGQKASSSPLVAENTDATGVNTSFTGSVPWLPGDRTIYAISPIINFSDPANIEYSYPSSQMQSGENADNVGSSMLMYAKTEHTIPASGSIDNATLHFKHLGAILRFHIRNTTTEQYKVKKIKISETGSNKKLYDEVKINLTASTPTFAPTGTVLRDVTLQVNDAPLMAAGATHDCYMTIAPQEARGGEDDNLVIEVTVENNKNRLFTKTITIPCKTSELIKNGFETQKRYLFSIGLSSLTSGNQYVVANIANLTTDDLVPDVMYLKLTGTALSLPKIVNKTYIRSLDLSEVIVDAIPAKFIDGSFQIKDIKLPSSITSIGLYAFSNITDACSLESIVIPDKVTHIGLGAFSNCLITSITIPPLMTTIGNSVFRDCKRLAYVKLPPSLETIDPHAFYGCISLKSITIPEGVTTIGSGAFAGSGLTSVVIPESVTHIGDAAFNISDLTSITIPSLVTIINELTFYACTKLKSVTLHSSLETIGVDAFAECTNLKSITIPEGVTKIDNNAFASSGLTSVVIPKSVTTMGEYTFSKCLDLTSVTISEGVTTIGLGAFAGCTNLTSVTIPEGVTTIGSGAFAGCINLKSIELPTSVTTIDSDAFYGSGLTSVVIPKGVKRIENGTFGECSGLASVTIPESVTHIGDAAFAKCSNLTSVTFPEGVTHIGGYAFLKSGLTGALSIPFSVKTIGENAFYGCTKVTVIVVFWELLADIPIASNDMFDLQGDGENTATIKIPLLVSIPWYKDKWGIDNNFKYTIINPDLI